MAEVSQLVLEPFKSILEHHFSPRRLNQFRAQLSMQVSLPLHFLRVAGEVLWWVPISIESPVLMPYVDAGVIKVGAVLRVRNVSDIGERKGARTRRALR